MPLAHCSIGTTTDRIDLLDPTGIHVGDWTPVAGAVDAVFSSSALADYRTLKYYREVTTEESIEFTIKKSSQDDVIVAIQNLRRMCRAAMDYWVESWQDEPVYIAVQASCETNRRYAIIHSAAVPEDNNPFGQPFLQDGNRTVMIQMLALERGPWLDTAPGVATCIEACAPENYYCWPSYLEFGAALSDRVNCGNGWGNIDDMPTGSGFTVEAWVRPDAWGSPDTRAIASKYDSVTTHGWYFYIHPVNGLSGYIYHGVQIARSFSGIDEFTPDGLWHHVAMTFSMLWGHNGFIRLWIDGTEVASYLTQDVAIGVYATDATEDLYIGNDVDHANSWDGAIGWTHVIDHPMWQADFNPDPRCEIPPPAEYQAVGVVSEGLWITEGVGATTINRITPGTGDGTITGATWDCNCILSYGRMCGDLENCWPAYCDFDGASEYIRSDDYAEIRSLPDDGNSFTVEAWVKAAGWGENNLGRICSKENNASTDGWYIGLDSTEGLYFFVYGGGGGADGEASSGLDEFSLGSWAHVVGTVTPTGGANATLNLAVNGTWVASYATHVNKTGNYQQDLGDALWFGNRTDLARTFDGSIGWIRFSTSLRYTVGVNFTPPARCALPDVDANTAGIWIYEGFGTHTWNLAFGEPALLTATTMWDCDCEYDVDQSTSCIAQPYIANYLKTSGLTNIYFQDASAPSWSGNLLYTPLPHMLLPPVPAVGDAVYFGVDSTLRDSGPFCNLVFDLMTAQGDLTGQWEYGDNWGGVPNWARMSVVGMGPQDNTDADGLMTGETFDTLGIKSVHWNQLPTPGLTVWDPVSLPTITADPTAPAVTAYWIRWVITAIGGSPTPPWQQNRSIYTISWPYIQIEDEDVPGDIAASMALELFNESDHDGGTNPPLLSAGRIVTGLRNLDRGEDFVAYLNAADEQNPPFITCTVNPAPIGAGAVSFLTRVNSPTGRIVSFTGLDDADLICSWSIDAEYSAQFFGEYRVFVRCDNSAALAIGDVALAFGISYGGTAASLVYGEWKYNEYFQDPFMVELGRAVIPPSDDVSSSDNAEIVIELYAVSGTAGVISLRVIDLILMPVDEWGGEFTSIPDTNRYLAGNRSMAVGDWGGKGTYLYVDSITYPKKDIRALSKIRTSENFFSLVRPVSNRPAPLRQNTTQRLWFLCERFGTTSRLPNFEIAHSVQIYSQAHYLSMRGDR